MEHFAELMQRLLEIQSGERPRSPELIAEDDRLMDGLKQRLLSEKPPQTVKLAQTARSGRDLKLNLLAPDILALAGFCGSMSVHHLLNELLGLASDYLSLRVRTHGCSRTSGQASSRQCLSLSFSLPSLRTRRQRHPRLPWPDGHFRELELGPRHHHPVAPLPCTSVQPACGRRWSVARGNAP